MIDVDIEFHKNIQQTGYSVYRQAAENEYRPAPKTEAFATNQRSPAAHYRTGPGFEGHVMSLRQAECKKNVIQ
jgi:hypothetical protein